MSARDFLFLAPLFVGLVIWGGVSYELHQPDREWADQFLIDAYTNHWEV